MLQYYVNIKLLSTILKCQQQMLFVQENLVMHQMRSWTHFMLICTGAEHYSCICIKYLVVVSAWVLDQLPLQLTQGVIASI